MRKTALFLSLLLTIPLCSTLPQRTAPNTSMLSYKIYTIAISSRKYDCKITIQNINTKQEYTTDHILTSDGFAFISNIPPGDYRISKVEIPLSDEYLVRKSPVLSNVFTISKSVICYLGSYTLEVPFYKLREDLTIIPETVENEKNDIDRLKNYLVGEERNWENLDIRKVDDIVLNFNPQGNDI